MIKYRSANEQDMDEVAFVHTITQPEYFTTTLGTDLLSKFYKEFLIEDNLFVVAYDDSAENKIVGFCMGNWYGSKAEKRWEEEYRKQIICRLLIKCIQFNSLAISRVLRRIKSIMKNNTTDREEDIYYSHLLSLGVLPEYRGQHIASTMIDIFEEKCLQTPHVELENVEKVCTIGAYRWNAAGCKLYFSKGYRIYNETGKKVKFRKVLNSEEN